ncbi:dTDP-4-dehydrorhamnose reductase [Parasutterella secunda]|uniref:dTDP-4-dehydrorhamnose reductase n=1 Tax=Parasutterella secunda TaxID=626947 RepID=A0ABS2GWR4_9BURK|nr:dTDP-4-dehydrorhamnose reductase [Parasutterella secunda]MBM6929298.1 dTDP-4-dehydrorhamnose reductase [Parasutterella secunda]
MPKFLILGKNGQVGWELQRSLALKGEVLGLGREDEGGDLYRPEEVASKIIAYHPDIVFNAAAYTAVDKAESEQDKAFAVNSTAVREIAQACQQIGAILVHYSTDYVFDGSGNSPRDEKAPTKPLNVYGQSKLAGEDEILRYCPQSFIFRASWVYGVHGKNFIKTILRLAQTKETLKVVSDQIGAPTSAEFIADISAELALRALNEKNKLFGICNLVPNGTTSWCDFAKWIVSQTQSLGIDQALKPQNIHPIPSTEYPTPAVRPLNSRLDNNKLRSQFNEGCIHDWSVYAKRILIEVIGH